MQASTQPARPPTPDVIPAPAAPVAITTVGADGKTQTLTIPRSIQEIQGLRAQRRELSGQLNNVGDRRQSLASQIANTSDQATRAGLEVRMRVLDQRILQIETDLATVGRQISSAPADLMASIPGETQGGSDEFPEGFMAGGFSVAAALTVVLLFRRWRRRRVAPPPSTPTVASDQRLERLEHGIEAIAIEIERVSEGQRFVTRLLAESKTPVAASNRIEQPRT